MRFIVQPLLEHRPDIFKRVGPRAPGMRLCIGSPFLVRRTNLAKAPSGCQTPNKLIKLHTGLSRRFRRCSRFEACYLALRLSKLVQKVHRVQHGELPLKSLLYKSSHKLIGQQLLARSSRRVIPLDYFAAFPRLRFQLKRGLEEVHV